MIARGVLDSFPMTIRRRGAEYWASGAVMLPRRPSARVIARVQGSRSYAVRLEFTGALVRGACACPYFDGDGACKHLWATLLAADEKGWLDRGARGPGSHAVVKFDEAVEDDETLDAGDADEDDAAPSMRSAECAANHWTRALATTERKPPPPSLRMRKSVPEGAEIVFALDVNASGMEKIPVLVACLRRRLKDGSLGRTSRLALSRSALGDVPNPGDRGMLSLLEGAGRRPLPWPELDRLIEPSWRIESQAHADLVARLASAGRLHVASWGAVESEAPFTWSPGPWRVVLELCPHGKDHQLLAWLTDGTEKLAPGSLELIAAPLAVLPGRRLAPIAGSEHAKWLHREHANGPALVPRSEAAAAVVALMSRPGMPELVLPEELSFREVPLTPRPCFDVRNAAMKTRLRGVLSFEYGSVVMQEDDEQPHVVDVAARTIVRRDSATETSAREVLTGAGLTFARGGLHEEPGWSIAVGRAAGILAMLVERGWRVTAQGKLHRTAGVPSIRVSTGIDWLDVKADLPYGDVLAPLPAVLRAARRGHSTVLLDDGSMGLLPEEWLRRNARWLALGQADGDLLRFRPSQAALLDALLADQPQVTCDATFSRIRKRLDAFSALAPAKQPPGFVGKLRDYQLAGLGWLEFLREFRLGGCLADDMGVGKTAQVLALLEMRRTQQGRRDRRPSLVVVPRSLIFNWLEEAARFTPQLKLVDLSAPGRDLEGLRDADVGLITYGTLRRDAVRLKDVELDYAILDEAQAIKNAHTASAKAARLLDARHRLVMTGTPVENHLGELWSLFEFLNPGMLGSAKVFGATGRAVHRIDEQAQAVLARALRPFLLRRTKQQVAPELPERTEQTIHCEMSTTQQAHYEAARDRYRTALAQQLTRKDFGRFKIVVLEALLRLRQIACHPGLVNRSRAGEESPKVATLLDQLAQVTAEGHKALVFSQFTSFLDIVRRRLDAAGIAHEDLDGKTADRAARVARFQAAQGPPVFLISLKAGGVGLNLTAADYVFLLDPWWNPAVEAQAIDRTHRIGQERRVFAYRLITSGTVEEKVLQLQARKRALADALLGDDTSLLGALTREDVEFLLG